MYSYTVTDSTAKQRSFHQVRQSLIDRHLVTASNVDERAMLSLHRTLKSHLLHLIDESGRGQLNRVYWRALKMVCRMFPRSHELLLPTNESWKECERSLPHVVSLLSIYKAWKTKVEANFDFATLLADTANYMWERGLIKDCVIILDVGDSMCEELSAHEEISSVHANICMIAGGVHSEIGISGRALAIKNCEKNLQIRQKQLLTLQEKGSVGAADMMHLANAWNDVGVMKVQNEDFEGSLTPLEESLRLKREWSSENDLPWHFGETYKNFTFIRLSQGQLDEAKDLALRSEELCSLGMPEKSATTQKARFIRATILLNCGEVEDALRMHKQILNAREEIFGHNASLTKDSIFIIGEICRMKGKLEKAENYFRRALTDAQSWPYVLSSFPSVSTKITKIENSQEAAVRAKYYLALVIHDAQSLFTAERSSEAARLFEEARIVREKFDENGLLSIMRPSKMRQHDFLVSLWASRMIRPNAYG